MRLLEQLVYTTACRSTHHRLAVKALLLMKAPEAERWRDLFLCEHAALLEGAKALDDRFKDFKNHVLHVRDGFWGGAVDAAEAWRGRAVAALRCRLWSQAAYALGVMSHYVVDPLHPFHTAQSVAENVIHRALEWSVSRSFDSLWAELEAAGGPPVITAPEGDIWLAQLIREGAIEANAHYDALIDHYDFAAGRRDPVKGLDTALRGIAAHLIGRAAATLACAFEGVIAEAGVSPPQTNTFVASLMTGAAAPGHLVLAGLEDLSARRQVGAMYAEFVRTGKIRATLPEDDRAVHALYAEEVLKTPLSNLDCEWPRPIGTAHGQPAPMAPRPTEDLRFRLSPDMDVVDAPSIGPKTAERFHAIGVVRVEDLLKLSPEEAEVRIAASHINSSVIRDWQAQAGLACSVPELTGVGAQLLVGAGVRDAQELAEADAAALHAAVLAFAVTSEGQRILRDRAAPGLQVVRAWIANARRARRERPSKAA